MKKQAEKDKLTALYERLSHDDEKSKGRKAKLFFSASISQLNGWTDEAGRVYLVFPVEKIAAALNRSLSSAKNALAELSAAGLIERKRRGQFLPNLIYVKLPEG